MSVNTFYLRKIFFLIVCLFGILMPVVGQESQSKERDIASFDLRDSTSVGFLLEDIQELHPQFNSTASKWCMEVMQKEQESAQSFPTDSIREMRFSHLTVPANPTVELRIMQFNIREDKQTEPDYNTFTGVRAAAIVEMVRDVKPDIICLQECRKTQAAYLASTLTEYTQILYPKDGIEKNGGQRDVILYKSSKMRLISWKKFWFSETPTVSSKSWDASTPKLTIYARFRSRVDSSKDFLVYCTHFPPSAPEAQRHSVEMMINSISSEAGESMPVFLCGDLNVSYYDTILDPLKEYMSHAAATALESDGVEAITYNGYRETNQKTLDHIFYRYAIVDMYHVKNELYQYVTICKWISDHYPLYSDVKF